MANHQSAKKRIRRNERCREVNGARVGRVRTYLKSVELAIASGDKSVAQAAFKEAQPELHRGVGAGVMHRKSAARRLSRLSARIKSMG
jgi:small subunit ribosomal protein S20